MEFVFIAAVVVFVAAFLFLVVVRRVLPVALKLAAIGAVLAMLLGLAGVGWWRGWFSSSSRRADRQYPQTNQRANTNRRPSPR